jgi:hypothetical protein
VVRTFLPLLFLIACLSSTAACTGGCWLHAGVVRTDPTTDCLTLFGGESPTDDSVCGVPQLNGVNNCSDALNMPSVSTIAPAAVFAPGQDIAWAVPEHSDPPALLVNHPGGGTTEYVISAALGSQSITITIPVHD